MDVDAVFGAADERKQAWESKQREAQHARSVKIGRANEFLRGEGHAALLAVANAFNRRNVNVMHDGTLQRGDHQRLPQEATIEPLRGRTRHADIGLIGLRHDGEMATAFYRVQKNEEIFAGTWSEGLAAAAGKLLDAMNGVGVPWPNT